MEALQAICYVSAMVCFLLAISRSKLSPKTLDYVAVGLFFISVPLVIEHLAPFV